MPASIENLNDEFSEYSFDLCLQATLPFFGEPEQYLNSITGTIRYFGDDFDGDEESEECGRLWALFVNFGEALNDGVSRLDVLDSFDDEFMECTGLFNTKLRTDSYLTKATQDILLLQTPGFFSLLYDNFVYVKRLEIVASHRGKRLGAYFLNLALEYLARTLPIDFFAMKPFPLQSQATDLTEKDIWKTRLALDQLEPNHQKAMRKLRELYSELGFELVRGTKLMICSTECFK